jgi:hypothetical protein
MITNVTEAMFWNLKKLFMSSVLNMIINIFYSIGLFATLCKNNLHCIPCIITAITIVNTSHTLELL